jgi:hypothetical protein
MRMSSLLQVARLIPIAEELVTNVLTAFFDDVHRIFY